LKIYVLATNRSDLYGRVSRLNQAIANRAEDLNPRSRELYDLLLKDAQGAFEGKTQLIIAPDAVSWGLPFQALRNEAERYLIEDFAITYTPSLTVFNVTATARNAAVVPPRRSRARTSQTAALLAVANPVLSQNASEIIKLALQVEPADPLIEAEKEVAALADVYGEKDGLLLTGAEAAEDRIKAEIGQHRFIHIAARGIHHEASPLFSLLAFGPNAEAREDGLLDLREVLRLDLKAELVVLSASEWAKPQTVTHRAMTAWTWGWFVAGTPATLISQWRAESPGTTNLMKAFHQQLKNPVSKSKAVAWQTAVKQLLSRAEDSLPYFWAGYTLVGDGR
jgi:CHAT domain-containing protein